MQLSSNVLPENWINYASLEEVMHVHEGGIIVLWWIYSVLVFCVI